MPDPHRIWAGALAVLPAILTLPVGAYAQACVGRAGLEQGAFETRIRGEAKTGAAGVTLRISRFLADAEVGVTTEGPAEGWSFVESNENRDPEIVYVLPSRTTFIGTSAGLVLVQKRVVACVMGRGTYNKMGDYLEDRYTFAFNQFVSISREPIPDSSDDVWEAGGIFAVGAEFDRLNPYGGFAGVRASSSYGEVSCSPTSTRCRSEVADLTEWYWWVGLSYRFSDRLRGGIQGREGRSGLWFGWVL